MHWYLKAFAKYGVLTGRASRTEFWNFILYHSAISFILEFLGNFNPETFLHVGKFYALLTFIPTLSIATRRLHDTGRSFFWVIFAFFPFLLASVVFAFIPDRSYGPIIIFSFIVYWGLLIFFLCQKGNSGWNKYGQDPQERLAIRKVIKTPEGTEFEKPLKRGML